MDSVAIDDFYETVKSHLLSGKSDFEATLEDSLCFTFVRKSGKATLKGKEHEVVPRVFDLLLDIKEVKCVDLLFQTTFSLTIDLQYKGFYINIANAHNLVESINDLCKVHLLVKGALEQDDVRTVWVSIEEGFDWSECGKILNGHFHTGLRDGKLSGMVVDRQSTPHSYKFWLWKGNPDDCRIPPGCNMNVGATALLLDRKYDKVALVCPNDRAKFFNFPGGNLDFFKDNWLIESTAFRESCEELGIPEDALRSHITSQLMVAMMAFPDNSFAGAINITICFFVAGLSKYQPHLDDEEIESGAWFDVDEILACDGTFKGKTISKSIITSIEAAMAGKGFRNVDAGVDFMKLWIPQ